MDKRSKLPRWINQYITEQASNLSTDMALVLSKHFLRTISQTQTEGPTSLSLWSLEDVERAQVKARELAAAEAEAEREAAVALEMQKNGIPTGMEIVVGSDDEFGEFGVSEQALATMDLDA